MRQTKTIISALAIMMLAAPATATQDFAKIAITPDSPKGAILIKAEVLPPPSVLYKTSYRLGVWSYDPERKVIPLGGPGLSGGLIEARSNLIAEGFMALDLKPGTYVLSFFTRQDRWSLCFHASTVQFTLHAGELLYLGELDVRTMLRQLETLAVSTGQTSLTNTVATVDFFDGVRPPTFAPIDEAGLVAAAAIVKAHMPRTSVAPAAAQLISTSFATSKTLLGSPICGGEAKKAH